MQYIAGHRLLDVQSAVKYSGRRRRPGRPGTSDHPPRLRLTAPLQHKSNAQVLKERAVQLCLNTLFQALAQSTYQDTQSRVLFRIIMFHYLNRNLARCASANRWQSQLERYASVPGVAGDGQTLTPHMFPMIPK